MSLRFIYLPIDRYFTLTLFFVCGMEHKQQQLHNFIVRMRSEKSKKFQEKRDTIEKDEQNNEWAERVTVSSIFRVH